MRVSFILCVGHCFYAFRSSVIISSSSVLFTILWQRGYMVWYKACMYVHSRWHQHTREKNILCDILHIRLKQKSNVQPHCAAEYKLHSLMEAVLAAVKSGLHRAFVIRAGFFTLKSSPAQRMKEELKEKGKKNKGLSLWKMFFVAVVCVYYLHGLNTMSVFLSLWISVCIFVFVADWEAVLTWSFWRDFRA